MKIRKSMANPKPKILFLGKLPPPYIGPALATQIILNSKLKDEFDLIHLDTSDHRDAKTLGAFDFWNLFLAFKHYGLLIWLLITRRPNIVYLPTMQTTLPYLRDCFVILIAKLCGRKVIGHLRGGYFGIWYASASPILKFIIRHTHRFVDAQIVLGKSLRHIFDGIVPVEKLHAIPNGRDFDNTQMKKNKSSCVTILFLANFIRTKGVFEVLEAIPDVYAAYPKTRFIFAGGWQDETVKQEFQAFLEKNPGLPVILHGPVISRKKFELLMTADIFVFPTYYPYEGHPWVIVEALAHGLPVISTDHASIAESVIDGYNGFLVNKQDANDVAEKLKRLIGDAGLRRRLAENSRRHYEQFYTEDKLVENLKTCFYSVLKK